MNHSSKRVPQFISVKTSQPIRHEAVSPNFPTCISPSPATPTTSHSASHHTTVHHSASHRVAPVNTAGRCYLYLKMQGLDNSPCISQTAACVIGTIYNLGKGGSRGGPKCRASETVCCCCWVQPGLSKLGLRLSELSTGCGWVGQFGKSQGCPTYELGLFFKSSKWERCAVRGEGCHRPRRRKAASSC